MEDISKINSQIKEGWENERGVGRELISINIDGVANRRAALKRAIEIAKSGDVVIFCGKGHEKSLCFGKTEYPWSDIEEVNKLLAR
jgi:UDP-N-acetylmuramoyl-L-alanyl-D-glutamate--2,6-diaminopimelate ligase